VLFVQTLMSGVALGASAAAHITCGDDPPRTAEGVLQGMEAALIGAWRLSDRGPAVSSVRSPAGLVVTRFTCPA
jgi:hypothetical protein